MEKRDEEDEEDGRFLFLSPLCIERGWAKTRFPICRFEIEEGKNTNSSDGKEEGEEEEEEDKKILLSAFGDQSKGGEETETRE